MKRASSFLMIKLKRKDVCRLLDFLTVTLISLEIVLWKRNDCRCLSSWHEISMFHKLMEADNIVLPFSSLGLVSFSLSVSLFFATLSWEKRPWKEVKERWRDSLEVLTLCLVFPCVIHLVYNILYCLKFQAGQTESKVVVKKHYTRQERLLFSSRLFLLFVTSHFKQNPCLISLFNP